MTAEPEYQRAADAYYELLGEVRELKRQALVPVVVGLLCGFVGASAHGTGYWTVHGLVQQGMYRVHAGTLLLAFALPAAPFVAWAVFMYRVRRSRAIRRWLVRARVKYDVPTEVLEERAAGLP